MGFSLGALLLVLFQGFSLAILVLAFYALILLIKALQIYIRKNRDF